MEAQLETALGRSTRLRLKGAGAPGQQAEATAPQADREKEFTEIARKEPLVQKALELFGGKIVDVVSRNNHVK